MALWPKLGMPAVYLVATKEGHKLILLKSSSEFWESSPFVRDSASGARAATTSLAAWDSNVENPLPRLSGRLLLFSRPLRNIRSSSSRVLFFLSWRIFSSASFFFVTMAEDEGSAEQMIRSDVKECISLLWGGAILTVPEPHTILEFRAESTAFFGLPSQLTEGRTLTSGFRVCWIG